MNSINIATRGLYPGHAVGLATRGRWLSFTQLITRLVLIPLESAIVPILNLTSTTADVLLRESAISNVLKSSAMSITKYLRSRVRPEPKYDSEIKTSGTWKSKIKRILDLF